MSVVDCSVLPSLNKVDLFKGHLNLSFSKTLYASPKRYHVKLNRLDYQSLFGKEAGARSPKSRELRKSILFMEIITFFVVIVSLSEPKTTSLDPQARFSFPDFRVLSHYCQSQLKVIFAKHFSYALAHG